METKGKSLCWVCEKPIEGGVFGSVIKTTSGDASACDKCSTHKWVEIAPGEIMQVEKNG